MKECKYITKTGRKCKTIARIGGYCLVHHNIVNNNGTARSMSVEKMATGMWTRQKIQRRVPKKKEVKNGI